MTKSHSIDPRIARDKLSFIQRMLEGLDRLSCNDLRTFDEDWRTPAAAESLLWRGLAALMDLSRHLLVDGFGLTVEEDQEIADQLREVEILSSEETALFHQLADHRYRLVHHYGEITSEELYGIVSDHLGDIRRIERRLVRWLEEHPERSTKP